MRKRTTLSSPYKDREREGNVGTRLETLRDGTEVNVQGRLEEELKRIKQSLGMNEDLRVQWKPDPSRKEEGEVKGRTIYVYSDNEQTALQTLKHEVLDFLVSQTIEPYKEFANGVITLLNKQAYGKKEEVIEKLTRLLT